MIFSCLTKPGGLPIDSYQVSPPQIPCSHITRPVNHGHWTPFRCYVKPVFLCVTCLVGYLYTYEQTKHNMYHKVEGCFTVHLPHEIIWNAKLDATRWFYWCVLSSTCFGYIRPLSGALDVELQHMVFCTEFLDGWWSWEPLRRSCVRCGCCRATSTASSATR